MRNQFCPLIFRRSFAFTLIELLVVISIISLLISILLPALGAAKKSAMSMRCQSNQRQVGILMNAYLNDWKGMWPGFWGTAPGQSSQMNYWNDRLARDYLENSVHANIMGCPTVESTTLQRLVSPDDYYGDWKWSWFGTYASRGNRNSAIRSAAHASGNNYYSVWDMEATTFWDNSGGVTSHYWVFSDSVSVSSSNVPNMQKQFFTISTYQPNHGSYSEGAFALRHMGAANVTFADGHVAAWNAENRSLIPARKVVDPTESTGIRDVPVE